MTSADKTSARELADPEPVRWPPADMAYIVVTNEHPNLTYELMSRLRLRCGIYAVELTERESEWLVYAVIAWLAYSLAALVDGLLS